MRHIISQRWLAGGLVVLAAAVVMGCPADTVTQPGTLTLAANPTSATVQQGGSAPVAVTATSGGGFSGTVTFAISGAPAGVTAVVSNIAVTGNTTTATVTIQVAASTTPGTHNLTLRAEGTGVAAGTAAFVLTVTPTPNYTLSLAPAALTLAQGTNGTTTVTINRTNFADAVTLSLGGAPAGVTGAFAPAAPNGTTSTLTVSVGATVTPGTYNLTVDGTGAPGNRSTPLTLTVTLPTVSFTAAAQTVSEGVGTATITAQLSSPSTQAVTVPFTVGGTATDPADYTITASPLTIAAGNTTATITVTVVADGVAEPNETVVVTMGTPTNATLGATTVHTVTIAVQTPTVSFTAAAQTVSEGVGTATITAQLSGPSTQAVTVPFTLTGTAASPADYTITASPLTIAAGNTTATITVTVVADGVAESDETIIVTMGTPTNATQGATTVHTVTITGQTPTVSFTAAAQSVSEGVGTATITAQLSSSSTQAVTVPFTVSGTATDPADYTISASPLTIAAGNTTATITVTVVADGVAEPDETVIVTMGTPTNATQGATTVHTVTIAVQTPTVSFTAAAQSVSEGVGTATITAQLSIPSTQVVTVPFTVGGTAADPADYTISASPLTIAAGNTTATITVTVVADAVTEPDETIIATLGTPTNATLGATTVHTVTIAGQTPTVSFTAAAQTVSEGVGTATITAQLSSTSTQAVTVPFTLTGTAASPADYTITASPLTITAGNTTATITVTVVADAVAEPNETVVVTMGTPTNATQGATTVHTVTITGQTPTVTFTAATQTVSEGVGTATITAQLSSASTQAVTVPFTVTGTAADPADYTITASPLTIAAGNTTATITVTVVADGVAESDETIIVTMGTPTNATQGATTVHTVTITGGGGGGNVTVSFAACPVADRAVWFAAQDGAGAWTRVVGVSDVYTFNVASGTGGIAYVVLGAGNISSVNVRYMTQAELTAGTLSFCGATAPVGRTISGTAAGLALTETASLALGGGAVQVNGFGSLAFQITDVSDGTHDLVGFRKDLVTPGSERGLLRRDIVVSGDASIGTVDFGGSESFPAASATITVGGLGGGESVFQTMAYQVGASCEAATLVPFAAGGATFGTFGVPDGSQRLNDYHRLTITAAVGTTESRTVSESFHTLLARTVNLGTSLGSPTISSLGGPYKRLQASFTLPLEYSSGSSFGYVDASTDKTVSLSASFGYFGGGSIVLALADYSGLAGWDSSWAPASASTGNWFASGSGSSPGSACNEGHRAASASRGGTF